MYGKCILSIPCDSDLFYVWWDFCKSLVELSFIGTYKSGNLLLPLSKQWTSVLQTHCSSYIFFQPLDYNLLLLPHYIWNTPYVPESFIYSDSPSVFLTSYLLPTFKLKFNHKNEPLSLRCVRSGAWCSPSADFGANTFYEATLHSTSSDLQSQTITWEI